MKIVAILILIMISNYNLSQSSECDCNSDLRKSILRIKIKMSIGDVMACNAEFSKLQRKLVKKANAKDLECFLRCGDITSQVYGFYVVLKKEILLTEGMIKSIKDNRELVVFMCGGSGKSNVLDYYFYLASNSEGSYFDKLLIQLKGISQDGVD